MVPTSTRKDNMNRRQGRSYQVGMLTGWHVSKKDWKMEGRRKVERYGNNRRIGCRQVGRQAGRQMPCLT
jgi:hypothetical protein